MEPATASPRCALRSRLGSHDHKRTRDVGYGYGHTAGGRNGSVGWGGVWRVVGGEAGYEFAGECFGAEGSEWGIERTILREWKMVGWKGS
jgi:hypothetical protein